MGRGSPPGRVAPELRSSGGAARENMSKKLSSRPLRKIAHPTSPHPLFLEERVGGGLGGSLSGTIRASTSPSESRTVTILPAPPPYPTMVRFRPRMRTSANLLNVELQRPLLRL